jgi:ABC-type bacteriocin/lantibiotic exporter with double-glycine peptidase domain
MISTLCRSVVIAIWAFVWLVYFATSSLGASLESTRSPSSADDAFTGDTACGPRCARYLLQYYNHAAPDLPALTRQLQWPDVHRGTSVARLQQFLQSYGVHTKAVHLPANALPITKTPWVARMTARGHETEGHFVVVLPGDSLTHLTICDDGFSHTMPRWEFSDLSSGVALLTWQDESDATPGVGSLILDEILFRAAIFALAISLFGGTAIVLLCGRDRLIFRRKSVSM